MKGTVKWIRNRTNNTVLLQVSACPPGETLTVKQSECVCVCVRSFSVERLLKQQGQMWQIKVNKQQELFSSFVSKYYTQLRVFGGAGAHVYKPPVSVSGCL